jgi:predicted acetyltransferase
MERSVMTISAFTIAEAVMSPGPLIELLQPARTLLSGYTDALGKGWSPNNVRDVSQEHLAEIAADPDAFLAGLLRQDGTITLPDGQIVPRLPSITRWMWDGAFCGSIGLRWQPGTNALPPHTLGHIGYAVVPWKRGRGYATAALGLILPHARAAGLTRLEITTEPDNTASQSVITKNGGRLVEEFVNPAYGPAVRLRFVIDLG